MAHSDYNNLPPLSSENPLPIEKFKRSVDPEYKAITEFLKNVEAEEEFESFPFEEWPLQPYQEEKNMKCHEH